MSDVREALRSDDALDVVGAALNQHTRTGESGLAAGCTCGRWDLLVMDWAWHLAEVALAALAGDDQ